MRKYNLIIIASLLVVLASCVKDKENYYLKDISSNERSIIGATVPNQVGTTVITNNDTVKTIAVKCLGKPSDLSAIGLQLAISYGASISPAVGTSTDFSKTSDNSVSYTVTSASGKTSTWKVICSIYENPYEGTWKINDFEVTWDDGNGWGNAGTGKVGDKLPGSQPGLDDVITFGTVSATASIVSGPYSRTAGADGQFASYINVASSQRNWDAEFGQLPAGTGTYFINADNTITISITGGNTYTSRGMDASKSTAASMDYELIPTAQNNGLINWNNYYGDFDNIACCSKRIWYVLNKQ